MLYDKAKIYVKAGSGGDGLVAFRKEKYVPEGGPAGGDGGCGASVIIEGSNSLGTMIDFKYKKHYRGDFGQNGGSSNKHGKNAKDLILKVPLGTIIKDFKTGEFLGDIVEDGQRITIAKGGRGGKGNSKFMTNKNKAPRYAEGGEPGEEKEISLELKLIADVGIAGFPNAGKSTLINKVTNANCKVGDYPFTTLEPQLGIVDLGDESFVIADIPGLVEGASKGIGLGLEFLKHLERTKIIIHLLDGSLTFNEMYSNYNIINAEISTDDFLLRDKKRIVVINKCDYLENYNDIDKFIKRIVLDGYTDKIFKVSALVGSGLKELMYRLSEDVKNITIDNINKEDHRIITLEEDPLIVKINDDGFYEVYNKKIERAYKMAYLASDEGIMRFYKKLVSFGVMDKLKSVGIKVGDTVVIMGMEFEYVD